MDAIRTFAELFTTVKFGDLPGAAVQAARQEVLDSLATAVGGSKAMGVPALVELTREWGGAEQSTVIGYDLKCPAPNAARANAMMTHALDYDDGHQGAQVHIGCVAVPTAFAVAERQGGVDGREFVTALALGQDFLCRLGLASRPHGNLIKSGWHPTPLCGYFGAAAIAGRLLKLNADRMVNALGIAYHQCAGNSQAVDDGAMTKRLGPGLAAAGGITAALMAERGITGAHNVLEGGYGFFNQYHGGDYDLGILTGDLGKRFEGAHIGDKPYPCCGFSHAFIDAVFALVAEHGFKPDDVQEIHAWCGDQSFEISNPLEVKRAPRNTIDSQFSLPWAVSTAMVKGRVTVNDFTPEAIKDKDVLAMAARFTVEHDPSMTRHGVGPAKLRITLKDGTTFIREVEHCLGSPERPMTFDDIAAKFRGCAPGFVKPLSDEIVEKTIQDISRLETLEDATAVVRRLG